eukprot:Polyplicarium_translucidae@DN3289_c0_g1_i2.p1
MRITMKGGVWKNSEDEVLKAAVMKYGLQNWSRVASLLPRKSAKQCKARWYEWLDPSVKKTEWTRVEEEKLLHLAKTFPTQWRTIAPMVGRTATQCFEHYERLLDQAQGKDISVDDPNDPRRIRPGEIDPHPETKPSRADAVDMADDEKEMLSEARARLANTRGKKAKRKAREKQLEEARRMATLQKRRELKAAGITLGRFRPKKREIDYGREIPFESAPPLGFHSVGPEETPAQCVRQANVDLQRLEGKRRDWELKKLRMEDEKVLKRLMETDLPAAMEKIDSITDDASKFKKRTKLSLPEPQLDENELDAIAKTGARSAELGAELQADGEGGSARLLPPPAAATPLSLAARTPQQLVNPVMLEAQNAVARTAASNPLEGGTNPVLHDVPPTEGAVLAGFTPGQRRPGMTPRTPHPLKGGTPAGHRALSAATTPVDTLSLGDTPYRDTLSLNIADDETASQSTAGAAGRKAKEALQRLHVKAALSNIPEPMNEVEIALPEIRPEAGEGASETPIAADMEDVEGEAAQERARRTAALSTAVRERLPRPYFLDLARFVPTFESGPAEGPTGEACRLLAEAESMVHDEMGRILASDAVNHPPAKGLRPPAVAPVLDDLLPNELAEAGAMVRVEAEVLKDADPGAPRADGEDPEVAEAVAADWEAAIDSHIYVPHAKRHVPVEGLSQNEKVDALRRMFDDTKNHLKREAAKSKKLEHKVDLLTEGYRKRQRDMGKAIVDNWAELQNAKRQLEAFRLLETLESVAAKSRTEELASLVRAEKERHATYQKMFQNSKHYTDVEMVQDQEC